MAGLWAMPGGWADVNEPPSRMVEREVREESGYDVRARRLIGVYESNHDCYPLTFWHNYQLLLLCDLVGGSPESSDETDGVAFFDPDSLPEISPFRTCHREIAEAIVHYCESHRPAYFD
jgi:ADP-ribose pyrophosphatase YjhB (NUDIX family)